MDFCNGFYHILVVFEGLCFYCSGQHCVLLSFRHEISLRMCGIKQKDCVSESISFLNVPHLEQSVQYRRWCGFPCFVEMSFVCFFFPPHFSSTSKITGICRGSEDISSLLSSNEVAKQKNNFSV